LTLIYFSLNGIKHGKVVCIGMPLLDIHPQGACTIGTNVSMVSNSWFATLGKNNRCKLMVYPHATLRIGNKVGMSNTTVVATMSIIIGDNVMIGGGVTIADSDFHSLNPIYWHTHNDALKMKKLPINIGNDVFIGMNSTILKGVTVGSNAVIAAESLVKQNIPANEVWGGNPAKFIRINKII
jgi:acetyltransferase-like isoleucine patch superfamily enzyme